MIELIRGPVLYVLFGVVKAALLIPVCVLIMTGGCTFSALLMWPRDVFASYRAVVSTGLIGFCLKVLVILLLPIPLILWPCLVVLTAAIVSIMYPLGVAIKGSFQDQDWFCGGFLFDERNEYWPAVRDVVNFTKDFWQFNKYSVFEYLEDIRTANRAELVPEVDTIVEPPPEVKKKQRKVVRGNLKSVSIQNIWDNFFIQCEETIRLGLRRKVLIADDIDSFASFIFIGVPAAVVVHCASTSNKHNRRTDILKLSNKLLMTPENRPHNYFIDIFYNLMVKLKHDMGRANLTQEQIDALWDAALRQDADLVSEVDSNPKATELLSQATRMGIHFSRLPQFHRRFQGALKNCRFLEIL